jgi:hypothetical protein
MKRATIKDTFGDTAIIEHNSSVVTVVAVDAVDDDTVTLCLTPEAARDFARALKKAARHIEEGR